MGWRFRRSVKLLPGVRINLGLRGASVSLGGRGITYNIGRRGSRVTLGLTGTGLSYSQQVSSQNPVSLIGNAIPSRRPYSATPFVLMAFAIALLYLLAQPSARQTSSTAQPAPARSDTDVVGSIEQLEPLAHAVDEPIPLPRPRPKRIDAVGPPLQLVPR